MDKHFGLTVIIPSHNKASYIRKCVESIYEQTLLPEEVIVFDDKSTDETLDVLDELKQKHSSLKVIVSRDNVGVSSARDIAIRSAKTEYVTFIDADDFYYSNNKLKAEMDTIRKYYKSTGRLCVAYSQTVLVDEGGIRTDKLQLKDWDKNLRMGTVARLYKYWLPRDYCFPKEQYIKVGGFDKGLNLYEDWDLNLRLYAEVPFVFSNEYGTAYRLNTGGLSSVDYRRHLKVKKSVYKRNHDLLGCSIWEDVVFHTCLYLAYIKNVIKH